MPKPATPIEAANCEVVLLTPLTSGACWRDAALVTWPSSAVKTVPSANPPGTKTAARTGVGSAPASTLALSQAIEHARAWVHGEVKMTQARTAAGHAMAAARDLRGAARHAAYAAGQAGAVAHVAAHELGAAAYAIKAARAGAPEGEGDRAGRLECRWQRDQPPEAIRALVLDDQRLRNDICWSVFDC